MFAPPSHEAIHARRATFREVRNEGKAFKQAAGHGKVELWDPVNGELGDREATSHECIGALHDLIGSQMPGSLAALAENEFNIHYSLFGRTAGQSEPGESTKSVVAKVDWGYIPTSIELYDGPGTQLIPREGIVHSINESRIDRKMLSNFSGWAWDATKNVADAELAKLLNLITLAVGPQNRLTRQVKACLCYLSLTRSGPIAVNRRLGRTIMYSLDAVLGEAARQGSAYIFSSSPGSEKHSLVLEMMGEAFPPAYLRYDRYVTIPADGESLCIVAYGGQPHPNVDVTIDASDVWASLCAYSADMGITDTLESAFVIACSIDQSRYFTKIGLPSVTSMGDLVRPMFLEGSLMQRPRPEMTNEMATGLGRIHQMLCFTLAKDVATAAYYSTRSGFEWRDDCRTFLARQESGVMHHGRAHNEHGNLFAATKEMRFLTYLDGAGLDHVMGVSIFEGLWLYNKVRKVVKGGVLSMLKSGIIDDSAESPSSHVLEDEFRQAGIAMVTMIDGDMTVMGTSVESLRVFVPRGKRFVTKARLTEKPDKRTSPRILSFKKPQNSEEVLSVSGLEVESDSGSREQFVPTQLKRRSTQYDVASGWNPQPESEEPPSPVLPRRATVLVESENGDEEVEATARTSVLEEPVKAGPSRSEKGKWKHTGGDKIRESLKKLREEEPAELDRLRDYLRGDIYYKDMDRNDKEFAIDQMVRGKLLAYPDYQPWQKAKDVNMLARIVEQFPLKLLEGAPTPGSLAMMRCCVNRMCMERGLEAPMNEFDFLSETLHEHKDMFPLALLDPESVDWTKFNAPSHRVFTWLEVARRFDEDRLVEAPEFVASEEWENFLYKNNIDSRTRMGTRMAREVLADLAAKGHSTQNLRTAYRWLSKTTIDVDVTPPEMDKMRNVTVEGHGRRKTDSNRTLSTSPEDGKILALQRHLGRALLTQKKYRLIKDEFEITPYEAREIEKAFAA
jgi:hypothetical protein